jgi:hypothetical protein
MNAIKIALIGAFTALVNLVVTIINFIFVTCLWQTICVLIIWGALKGIGKGFRFLGRTCFWRGICKGFFRDILWRKFLQHRWRRTLQWILLALPLATCGLILWWYIYDYETWASTPPFNFVMGIVTFIVITCGVGFFQEIRNYLRVNHRWLIAGLAVLFTTLCIIWLLVYHPSLLLATIVWAVLIALVIVLALKRIEFCNWVTTHWWRFILYLLAVIIFIACLIHFGPIISKALWSVKWWVVGISAITIITILIVSNWPAIRTSRAWPYIEKYFDIPLLSVITVAAFVLWSRAGIDWMIWLATILPITIIIAIIWKHTTSADVKKLFKFTAWIYFATWALFFILIALIGVNFQTSI